MHDQNVILDKNIISCQLKKCGSKKLNYVNFNLEVKLPSLVLSISYNGIHLS